MRTIYRNGWTSAEDRIRVLGYVLPRATRFRAAFDRSDGEYSAGYEEIAAADGVTFTDPGSFAAVAEGSLNPELSSLIIKYNSGDETNEILLHCELLRDDERLYLQQSNYEVWVYLSDDEVELLSGSGLNFGGWDSRPDEKVPLDPDVKPDDGTLERRVVQGFLDYLGLKWDS